MIAWILWSAPNTGPAKHATSAIVVIVWAVHLSPGVGAALLNPPTLAFGVFNCVIHFFLRMRHSYPGIDEQCYQTEWCCQLTTFENGGRLTQLLRNVARIEMSVLAQFRQSFVSGDGLHLKHVQSLLE